MKNLKRYSQLFENTQELTQEQKDWLDKCTGGTWKINPRTGLVDVSGVFDCDRQGLTDFKGVRFGSVSGLFDCSDNELTSLEGAPQSVGWGFYCTQMNLTDFKGVRFGQVSGNFYCYNNSLTSLEGAPQRVDGYFHCSNNELTSLEGLPDGFSVGVGFICRNNPISERAIKGVLKRMGDNNISLEQAVAEYWKWIPQEDRVYLAKHHPSLPEKNKRIYRAIELNMKRR